MKKNKRYFHDDSKSEHSRQSRSYAHRRSRSPNRYHHKDAPSNKSNKLASEKLKKAIQEQIKNASSSDTNKPQDKIRTPYVSLEDQVKLVNSINEINHETFEQKNFVSSRSMSSKSSHINLLDIPLPKDNNSWIDNPKILINPKVI